MTYVTAVFISIILLFAVFLLLRSVFSIKVCALCGAVSLTWIALLVLFYRGVSIDPLLIGILMGGSIVGVLYLLKEKVPEQYTLYTLPLFLTGTLLVYFLLVKNATYDGLIVVGFLWLVFAGLFAFRNDARIALIGRKIIECCKNW